MVSMIKNGFRSAALRVVLAVAVVIAVVCGVTASGVSVAAAGNSMSASTIFGSKQDEYDKNAQQIVDTIKNSTRKLYVIDAADILSEDEEEELAYRCEKASKNCETDIVIITMRTGKDYAEFDNYIRDILETYYGYFGTGTNSEAIIYGIDMVSRADRIITSGKTRSDISQSTLDSIRENAEEKLADGDYCWGCKKFINGVERQMNNSFWYEFTLYMPMKLLIALVITVVVVLSLMAQAKSKMTVNSRTYASNQLKVHDTQDRFIRTTVTTRHIERSSSGGGGGGGGGGNSGSSGGHF